MSRTVFVCGTLVILMTVCGCGQQRPPTAQGSELQTARGTVVAWVNSMKGKTPEQITGELGEASERDEWKFEEKSELVLRYKTKEPRSTLELYFLGDRVISVSLQLLSD